MNDTRGDPASVSPAPASVSLPLPVHRPVVTYVLLAGIGVIFLLELLLTSFAKSDIVFSMGAQFNNLVAAGEYWRLFTAMFLHGGLAHLAFNAFALYSLGSGLERYYGSIRFLLIYVLSGLAGGVLYFVLGPGRIPSVGASGAIFGVMGAELAYIVSNRKLFGVMGQQRLKNLLFFLVINTVFNLAIPNLNKLAHVGGFLCGMALGFALTPRYDLTWDYSASVPKPMLLDRSSRVLAIGALLVAVVLLALGLLSGGFTLQ
jgi:rhomboid protease GluP